MNPAILAGFIFQSSFILIDKLLQWIGRAA